MIEAFGAGKGLMGGDEENAPTASGHSEDIYTVLRDRINVGTDDVLKDRWAWLVRAIDVAESMYLKPDISESGSQIKPVHPNAKIIFNSQCDRCVDVVAARGVDVVVVVYTGVDVLVDVVECGG